MNISDMISKLNLTLLTSSEYDDRDVTGVYTGDLLSWVMGRVQSGNAWITIMNNINIVAVASLTDAACIILAEGVIPEKEIIKKADSQDVVMLASDKTSYELAAQLHEVISI